MCKKLCPNDCFSFAYVGVDYNDFKGAILNPENCNCCGKCVENCPIQAINLKNQGGPRCAYNMLDTNNGNNWESTGDKKDKSQEIKKTICETFTGTFNVNYLKKHSKQLTLDQEQFIINFANIAALSTILSASRLNSLKVDLKNYKNSSSLYSKYSKLDNHKLYTQGWSTTFNSSPNSNTALVSPKIINSNYQLKFYPEKNGETNALGLIKGTWLDHGIEAVLEFLEGYMRDTHNSQDDFLIDMHFFNALNFMEVYCNV
jgi:Fe-S-cluster-containing hydrogenase component 2